MGYGLCTLTPAATEGTNYTAVTGTSQSVSVVAAPVITFHPVSQNVCQGARVSFGITASNATSFQWFQNDGSLGTNPPSAATSTLQLTNVQPSQAGKYTCTATNSVGASVTSSAAILDVITNFTKLSIEAQPISTTVYVTQSATFQMAAAGTGTLTYQWYKKAPGDAGFTAISGATSSFYTTSALNLSNSGTEYYVTVTDGQCQDTTITSNTVTVTVSSADTAVPPTITVQPAGQTAPVGSASTAFSVTATGQYNSQMTFQWYQVSYTPNGSTTDSGTSQVAGSAVGTPQTCTPTANAPACTMSYTLPATATTQANDGDNYYVLVTNKYGQAVSIRAVLAVGLGINIQIKDQPQSEFVQSGEVATFTTTATCAGCIPAHQWYYIIPGSTTPIALSDQKYSSGNLEGATVSGSNSDTLSIQNAPASANGTVYYAVVTATSDGSTQIAGTHPLTTNDAGLFVNATVQTLTLCNTTSGTYIGNWQLHGTHPNSGTGAYPGSGEVPYQNTADCSVELTDGGVNEQASIWWPIPLSTSQFTLSFTVQIEATSGTPADGFSMLLGDIGAGATTKLMGRQGEGLGAADVPALVLGFDTYQNGDSSTTTKCTNVSNTDNGACDPVAVPYMAVGRGEGNLWENPWTYVNGYLDTQNSQNYLIGDFTNSTHKYTVTASGGVMTVKMDGNTLFSGRVAMPPVAYLGFAGSTGGSVETVIISNLSAIVISK